jgi:hypothetical protein
VNNDANLSLAQSSLNDLILSDDTNLSLAQHRAQGLQPNRAEQIIQTGVCKEEEKGEEDQPLRLMN